ncbi:hypothetical protein GLAREA_11767 [Glarea lozoyensis ATCC 20868]|uniref:CBF1-interacting co-repressor CIR N-terminal domain-containing protein n=1 Tax=Glarea lozoyensis (strain ATCC 20868 / MF5171) TaxID=1116229 RepID=S3CZC2_GLAL2|nr:uncharacterized protein GLAREA_11767 [Glarea lozoyensis ATCC 20868]EPE25186.1 hypothetical protein GLAREA_11767 [Glarea lozoyensis ATCC 20868]
MGGDLNLKKSWHPVLMSNQRRVWEEEKKALDERKRTDQRIKELKEERAKEEIQNKLEAAGSRKRVDRVDWMYQGPSSGQAGTTEEMEGYLLGKRRIDGLLKGTEHKKLEKAASEESFMALQHANTIRDTASKIREDPMLAIKKQEQAAYEAMMNDPIKRRQMLALAGKASSTDVAEPEKRRRRHHHRHRDTTDEDRESRKRRRRSDSREHRGHRSGSDDERDSRRRRYRDYSDDERDSRRRRHNEDRNGERDVRRRRSTSRESWRHRSVSREPRPHRSEKRHSVPSNFDSSGKRPLQQVQNSQSRQEISAAERQAKLDAMRADASDLDADRENRLKALAAREAAEREEEDKARSKSSKYTDKGNFMKSVHQKAGEIGLADRIGRGRQGFSKDDD